MKLSIIIDIDISDEELKETLQSAGYTVEKVEEVFYDKVHHNQLEERIETSECVVIGKRKVSISQAFTELYLPRIKDASIDSIQSLIHQP